MKKTKWMNLLLVLSLVLAGCGLDGERVTEEAAGGSEEPPSEIDVALDALWESWDEAEDAEAKVALAREFLETHPGSEHTSDVMGSLIGPLVEELGREEEAYAIFEEALAEVSDPEERFEARKKLAVLHTKTGRLDELHALTQALEEEYEFQFTDYLDFMETAVEAQAWELAIQQADASLALATPEAFREQWPDIAEEDAEAWGRRREAFAAAHKGWALQNLGRHEEALETFAANSDKSTYSSLGVDDTPLHLRWGMSLNEQDRPEEAMAVLEAEALFGPEEASAVYAEAWAASRGTNEGLEEHLWDLRVERGKPLPGFALANYEGETIDSADFEGDVLLVAAWFPT